MIEAGEMAPEFELETDRGDTVRLEDLRGKRVVLFFYPKDDTSGCTKEACGFRDRIQSFETEDAAVLGISPDDVRSHEKFRDKYDLNFSLLSDEDHAIIDKYGCWQLKKFMGKEKMGTVRTTFIIGKDGRLKTVMDKFKTKTHHETLLEVLDELQ